MDFHPMGRLIGTDTSAVRTAEERVVYLSPRGKRCMLVPLGGNKPWLYFRYLDDTTLAGDGFSLTHAAFRIMREAPRQQQPSLAHGRGG